MILILDDHPVARQGLESIIQMYKPEAEIVQAGSVKEAVTCSNKYDVEIAFIDINLGEENGFDFLETMRERGGGMKVFMITSSSDESDFLRAKALGVDAYLLKDAFIDDIMYSLKVVERGGKFYSGALIDSMNSLTEEERMIEKLTRRETEVLYLLKEGYSNVKISESLYISEGTVKKHISNLLSKLGLDNRVEAVLFAGRNGKKLQFIMKTIEDNELKQ